MNRLTIYFLPLVFASICLPISNVIAQETPADPAAGPADPAAGPADPAAGPAAPAAPAAPNTVEEKARKILDQHKPAIVVITAKGKLVTTTTGDPLPQNEQQRRTLGVTIAENGLVAVSNVAIDASVGLVNQQARIDGKVVTIQTAKTEFTEVEISYGDSTVLKGKVIRQDMDADIAFILPDPDMAKALSKKFDMIDLSKFDADAALADQVIGLSRSSAIYAYMPTVMVGRITGIFSADRTYYVTTAGTGQGIVVFNLEGEPIGITVVRIVDGRPSGVLGTLSAGSIQVMAKLALDSLEN
ncbi:MAG: hypothetical protein HKN23_11775 [Verrucomicrobiales bacterium]|nr:hypothetical protein [Verrucomicrobiales bacterium]